MSAHPLRSPPVQPEPPPPALSLLAHEPHELLAAGRNCLAAGQLNDAETLFRAAAMRRPADPETRYRLASALIALGRLGDAQLALADARELHARLMVQTHAADLNPSDLSQVARTAEVFYANHLMAAASHLHQQVVAAKPDDPQAWVALGLALQHQGRAEESVAVFEAAVRRWPQSAGLHSFLVYARMFRQETPQTNYDEGRRWQAAHAEGLPRMPTRAPRREGKLRIGYYAPLFNRHQMTHFFRPAFEHHDRSRFELVIYSGAEATDECGAAIKAGADLWRDVTKLGDQAFAEQVAADGIDILVDLWGHTAGNHLTMFARKPAPIQVSWINYIETTGLTAFDHVLHADNYNLDGAQSLFSETIRPVGPVLAPFRPPHDLPPPGPTPALSGAPFTFASFVHPGKVTLEVVRVWAIILANAPNAVLTLRYSYFKDPAIRRSLHAQFEAFGIPAERILFGPHETGEAFLRAYQTADLVLDPFPYQGMTTTMDALVAGVPVLTYEGARMNERIAATSLRVCGLDALVANDLDDYVARAVAFAGDPAALDAIRQSVRPAFDASPYRDEAGFTKRLEAEYEAMVAAWWAGA